MLIGLLATLGSGCGHRVALVPHGPIGSPAPKAIEVSELPPPAKVEVVPLRRHDKCLWQDGHWDAERRVDATESKWRWVPGAWVLMPTGCHYVPPQMTSQNVRNQSHLLFTPGAYYSSRTGDPCPEPKSCE